MPAYTRRPATLAATRVSFDRGPTRVLHEVSVTVTDETRLGVVGPNGVGKTTLLRVLSGQEQPSSGRVELSPSEANVGYLAQERQRSRTETVRAYLHRRAGVSGAEAEMTAAAVSLSRGDAGSEDRYSTALERWESLGGGDLDSRLESVLDDLELPARLADSPTASLSGGQAARAELASVLLSRFDLTLLDEPTNDLDFDGLALLEQFVIASGGGFVMVSHDRAFLERTVTSVLELEEHTRSGSLFAGGWQAYLEERATNRRHAEESYATYRAQRQVLLDRARRERQWATTGVSKEKRNPRDNDKAQRDFRLNRTEKLAARARQTENALDRLATVEKPWEGWQLRLSIRQAERAGSVVARLDNVVARRGDFVLGPLDLEIGWAERLAITGPNGSGKTTLLAALLGRVTLDEGSAALGPSVRIGEVDQARELFMGDEPLLEAFSAEVPDWPTAEVRTLLAKFGLVADHVVRTSVTLSPGERTRAALALLQARGVNVLVLDEPTNHLDLAAIEQLEEALAAYEGTLLLVTHDRRMLEAVHTTRRLAVDAGQVTEA